MSYLGWGPRPAALGLVVRLGGIISHRWGEDGLAGICDRYQLLVFSLAVWRGPIWFPTTFLIIESLRILGAGYRDDFKLSIPGDSGGEKNLLEIAGEIANRMIHIFSRNQEGKRPIYGGARKFQEDPYWKDLILFYEFYNGEDGAGLGASHQTGWSALVAALIDDWRR